MRDVNQIIKNFDRWEVREWSAIRRKAGLRGGQEEGDGLHDFAEKRRKEQGKSAHEPSGIRRGENID